MTKFEFYSIACRIYYTFDKNDGKISNFVPTKAKYVDYLVNTIPAKLYQLDKPTAAIACFYINYKYSPSSLNSMFNRIKNIELSEITQFKFYIEDSLRTYKKEYYELQSDRFKMNLNEAINAYNQKRINFISFYYFCLKNDFIEEIRSNILYKIIFSKIEPLILFLKTSSKVNLQDPESITE